MSQPRVAAVVLPQLLVELAGSNASGVGQPLAVVWEAKAAGNVLRPAPLAAADGEPVNRDVAPHARVVQVAPAAFELGVRPGMTVAAARGYAPQLLVRVMTPLRVKQALFGLAEGCLVLSPRVAVEEPDALLMDASGLGRLFPSEQAWMEAVAVQLRLLGHAARIAVASGPDVALAVARYGHEDFVSVPHGRQKAALLPLPVDALGVQEETRQLLVEAGLRRVADVARQPRAALARRMGRCSERLRLLDVDDDVGADARPLRAITPPEKLMARLDLSDHPEESSEALLFWLKRVVDPLCARMRVKELAALELDLTLFHGKGTRPTPMPLPLALPLWNPADILGAYRPLFERTGLPGPVHGLFLQIPRTTDRPPVQAEHLDARSMASEAPRVLSAAEREKPRPQDVLARLWAELVGEVGQERVGILGLHPTHAPEQATWLYAPGQAIPVPGRRKARARANPDSMQKPLLGSSWYPPPPAPETGAPPAPRPSRMRVPSRAFKGLAPLRVLHRPVTLPGWPVVGQPLGPGFGVVKEVAPARRLHSEWWRGAPLKRDYLEVLLESGEVGWLYLEPHTGRVELQGWLD